MKQGFVPEARDTSYKISTWFADKPRKGWFGFKLKGVARYPIEVWRCDKCSFLESYAPDR